MGKELNIQDGWNGMTGMNRMTGNILCCRTTRITGGPAKSEYGKIQISS